MKDEIYKALIEAARPRGAKTRKLNINEATRQLDLKMSPAAAR